MKFNTLKILGIEFFNGKVNDVVQLLKKGGLLVVPSGPGLETIKKDVVYYKALRNADLAIADSGYMALIWNIFNRKKISRISGLEFLVEFFADKEVQKSTFTLVNPTPKDADANVNYLNSVGFNLSNEDCYQAPMYDKNNIMDPQLLANLEKRKPAYILMCVGGGTQEQLGSWLKDNLSYRPAIICTGAAIAFLTGRQASIPTWGDRLFVGWLFRCIEKPKVYIPRYLKAVRLFFLMIQYGEQPPVAI
ncbi:MAG: WecB/TagA/CpsF family glycosyltransferase [Chryseolinea sp.]